MSTTATTTKQPKKQPPTTTTTIKNTMTSTTTTSSSTTSHHSNTTPHHHSNTTPTTTNPTNQTTHTPTTTTQRFCLRWNNHQSNLLSVFDQLLHDESFVDVTLAVEGQLLKAHKMVLSACSPYFQQLFVAHSNDRHPIVILKDVPFMDMRCLLDFMYRGEVSVDQDRLTHFLRVAESLRIKGLTEVNEEQCDNIASTLSQQQQQQQQHFQNLPNLQRLSYGGATNKRFAGNHLNMLSNALLQPKRKRGRPRKLSGCSNGDDFDKDLVQGSPEMLEVKMGVDNFGGNNSDSSVKNDDDEKMVIKEEENEGNLNKKLNEDFHPADIMTQKLITPKTEIHHSDYFTTPNTPTTTNNNNNNNSTNNNPPTPSTSTTTTKSTPAGTHGGTPGGTSATSPGAPGGPPAGPTKRRVRRRATSQCHDPAEALTEMSVRGLNLFRYASITEGVYQCTECAKVDVQKTFKNKYSFQRHAFLYHEGQQRKVFPCPVCQKEFSRPDKMKNHMKTVHDCFMPKDVVFPSNMGFFPTM